MSASRTCCPAALWTSSHRTPHMPAGEAPFIQKRSRRISCRSSCPCSPQRASTLTHKRLSAGKDEGCLTQVIRRLHWLSGGVLRRVRPEHSLTTRDGRTTWASCHLPHGRRLKAGKGALRVAPIVTPPRGRAFEPVLKGHSCGYRVGLVRGAPFPSGPDSNGR